MNLEELIRVLHKSDWQGPTFNAFECICHYTNVCHGIRLDGPEHFGYFYKIAQWDTETLFSRKIETAKELAQILEHLG